MVATRSIWARLIAGGLVLCLATGALYAAGEGYKRRDWRDRFLEMKGRLARAEETLLEESAGQSLIEFRLTNDRGLRVRGNVRVATDQAGPQPVLLILGGLRTGRETLAYLGPSDGVVLVALDYPYDGKKERLSPWEFLRGLPAMRHAVLNTVPAAMLAVDYLLGRDDVDPRRIVLVGGSLGALFSPAVADDERVSAVALLFGGADLQTIARANLKAPVYLDRLAAWILSVLVSPVEPSKYIGRISPRPLLMLSATGDRQIPERCARLLHERAGTSKTVRWIAAGHVHVRDEEFGRLVARELASWLADNDLAPRQALDSVLHAPAVRPQAAPPTDGPH